MKHGKKSWILNLVKDLSPTSSGASRPFVANGTTKSGHMDNLPTVYKILGLIFAIIGALGTIRWFMAFLLCLDSSMMGIQPSAPGVTHSDTQPEMTQGEEQEEPHNECESSTLITELTERLQMLEMAFKEQVYAREMIAREVNDQSDVYGNIDRKLASFFEKLDNISYEFSRLENKYNELSHRVSSDENAGLVVILILVLQVCSWFRPKIMELVNRLTEYRPELKTMLNRAKLHAERKIAPMTSPGTPKKMMGLRNEVCVIFFQRESANSMLVNLTEAMLRHLDGVKVAFKPYYSVFAADDLRNMPHVRLYVIVVDLETKRTYINGSEKDLVITTIKFTKSIGGVTVVVVANDEGSKNLTAHSVYNSSIRLIKSNDCLQELAANGKLFSMWQEMTSHQLSHLRRVIKSVLNLKTTIR